MAMSDQNHPLDTGQELEESTKRAIKTRKMKQQCRETVKKIISLLSIDEARSFLTSEPMRYLGLSRKRLLLADHGTIVQVCSHHFKWYDYSWIDAIRKIETFQYHTELLTTVKQLEDMVHKYFRDPERLRVTDSKQAILMIDSEYPSTTEGFNEEKLYECVDNVLEGTLETLKFYKEEAGKLKLYKEAGGKHKELKFYKESIEEETTELDRKGREVIVTTPPIVPKTDSECFTTVIDAIRDEENGLLDTQPRRFVNLHGPDV